MRFGPHLLDEVLRRTDIVQLVGRRVKLVRKGRVMWGCCPFHKEKSASFKVENERRTYKCFGCGAGGDAFKWLMETEGLNFPEAVERLAGEAGVELPKWTPEEEQREARRKSLYEIVELACVFFEDQLRAKVGTAARDYLRTRALDGDAARQFRLGYAPPSGSALIDHLKAKAVSLDDLVAAGLARGAEDSRPARDFFFNRVIFPIADTRGRVVAFGARALDPDAKPKYINTSETPLFSKGGMLYNFAKARPAAIRDQTIVAAEGYMDVIALVRAGIEASVAPLGTALTGDQLNLLWRVAAEPVLAFDGDAAGLSAAKRAARLALPQLKPGYSLRFAFLPPGEDPDSFVRAHGAAAMKALLNAAEPLANVLWRSETEDKEFSTPERRAGLERALGEIVAEISDAKIADYYRREFDNRVFETFKRRAPYAAARTDQARTRGPSRQSGFAPPSAARVSSAVKNSLLARSADSGALKMKEAEIGGLLLEKPDLALTHGEVLAELPLSSPLLDRLRHELLNLAASGFRLEKRALETHLARSGIAEIVAQFGARPMPADGTASLAADEGGAGEELEARWLRAVRQLQDLAESTEKFPVLERLRKEAALRGQAPLPAPASHR